MASQDFPRWPAEGNNHRSLEERQERISQEIQNGVIHTLFGVGLSLQAAASETEDPKLRARLERAIADLDRAVRELREALFKEFTV